MPFTDVIDDYTDQATGTINVNGDQVGYTVSSGVNTLTYPNTDAGAQVTADGQQSVEVTFDAPVVGISLSFDRSNAGEIYFVEIEGTLVDLNILIADGDAVFTSAFANGSGIGTHEVTAAGGISSTGNFNNGSLGFVTFSIPISRIGVTGTGGNSGNFDIIEIGVDPDTFNVVCFAAGTDIMTPTGPVPVADLRSGDVVMTASGTPRRIIQTHARHITRIQRIRETRLSPVRISAGALGAGLPERDLLVSRQHRVLVASRIAARITGHTEILVSAVHLVGLPGIEIDHAMAQVTYHHLLLDCHDVVLANGAPAETLYVGPISAKILAEGPPEISVAQFADSELSDMAPARPFPDPKDARKIVAAHIRHDRPVLEEWPNIATNASV